MCLDFVKTSVEPTMNCVCDLKMDVSLCQPHMVSSYSYS